MNTEASRNIIMTVWLDGEILEANDVAVKMSGYSREELLGSRMKMMSSWLHTKHFWMVFWSTILEWKEWNGDICNKRKDGSLVWLRTRVIPVLDDAGNVARFNVIRQGVSHSVQRP